MDFDPTSLNPIAMWDESLYPKKETGYFFTNDMNDELVEKFNSGTFSQKGAILKIKYYNPPDTIFQHLHVKERAERVR